MEVNWYTNENEQLLEAVTALKDKDEAKDFLRDLLTPQEITEFSKRLEAARLLSIRTQYNTIIDKTGLSSTTIARIAKWLKGPAGGYRIILRRLYPNSTFATNFKHHSNPKSKPGKGLSLKRT